jgi:eukaryotic-like serine/threonine-protein kinase
VKYRRKNASESCADVTKRSLQCVFGASTQVRSAKLPGVTDANPPPEPAPKDSEPAALPSLPAETALWGDSDITAMQGPAAVFKTNAPNAQDEQIPTIGHIGRYALKYKLGEGGLGTVFAAHDPLLSRLIAVKTLNLELDVGERDAFNALFLNEARAAGGLSHPHIVTVFDAGISDNRVYIAMELLKGRDLRQLRQEGWRATPAQAAMIVRRVADALAYAHSKGVVHRDIKPANIFMVGRTQPRVLDFGIARVAHQHEAGASSDIAAGSPYYMAPEQVRQETVDRRADVFSLGVVLYELLTDLKPFRGSTLTEITDAVLKHDPPLANKIDANVPEALAQIAARAMEKNPDTRFRSARSFARELRHWLDENTVTSESEVPNEPAPRSRRLWLAAAAAGAVLIAAAAWLQWAPRPAPEVAAAAPPSAASLPAAVVAAASAAVLPVAASVVAAPELAGSSALPDVAVGVTQAAPAPLAVPVPVAVATPTRAASVAAKDKESPKDKRLRETREREAKVAAAAPVPTGLVRIAVSPWGEIEVDGRAAGTAPPLTELSLPEGKHQIVIRNTEFPPYNASVIVTPGQPVSLKYKF